MPVNPHDRVNMLGIDSTSHTVRFSGEEVNTKGGKTQKYQTPVPITISATLLCTYEYPESKDQDQDCPSN